jgi:hypothetical protein
MRANRYLHIAVIGATLLFLVLWQTAAAKPPEKPGNPGLPGCLAKVSELEERIEELEAMLENFAAVPQTGQTTSWGERDDGDLQKGVPWPNPRFTDNGDGTVADNLTGLIWLKNADCLGRKYWNEALDASNNLADGDCGLNDDSIPGDWRLPNIRELHSLIDYGNFVPALPTGHPFTGVHSTWHWSSSTDDFYPGHAWMVGMSYGEVSHSHKDLYNDRYVWPIRGGND